MESNSKDRFLRAVACKHLVSHWSIFDKRGMQCDIETFVLLLIFLVNYTEMAHVMPLGLTRGRRSIGYMWSCNESSF